jgi:hypothetical protein
VQKALDTLEAHAVGCGEGGGGGSFAVGGDQLGDVALIEAVTQAPRTLHARSRGTYGTGESRGVAKTQLSGLCGVRVSGKYLRRVYSRSLTWSFMRLRCASPFIRRCGRAAIYISGLRADGGRFCR